MGDVLRAPGRPLEPSVRARMQDRFGYDFTGIRVHADGRAAESARTVGAAAYTLGNHVVFGEGHYRPGTEAGDRLVAHELAHAVQQGGESASGPITLAPPGDKHEREADTAADQVTSRGAAVGVAPQESAQGLLQRTLAVSPVAIPMPAGVAGPPVWFPWAVQGLIDNMCPTGGFIVDQTSGAVAAPAGFCEWHAPLLAGNTEADLSPTPAGCRCLCDVCNSAQTATIEFRPGGPSTAPGSVAGAGPGQGGVATDSTVRIDPQFQGQYRIAGQWVDLPFHLLLSHELCGHALPKMQGSHVARGRGPAGGTPPQERAAVDVERQIAAEHSPPLSRRPEDYSGAARQRP